MTKLTRGLFLIPCSFAFSSVALSNTDFASEMDDLFDSDVPVVLSATRLKQPRNETPAAVTVIDAKTIAELHITHLAEIFRLVPGMTVGYERGHVPEVGYHALGGENSRHLQVLIDGRSVYQAALARILWDDLPLPIDKIARIEVIRGGNSAIYGANSFLAVINIITRHPDDRLGQRTSLTTGNHGIGSAQHQIAQSTDAMTFDLSVGFHANDGFEIGSSNEQRFDRHESFRLSGDHKWDRKDNDYWRLQYGTSKSNKQIDGDDFESPDPYHTLTVNNHFIQANARYGLENNEELTLQAFATRTKIHEDWTTCLPALFLSDELFGLYDLDSAYTEQFLAAVIGGNAPPIPSDPNVLAQAILVQQRLQQNGANEVCGTANQNLTESRYDVEATYSNRWNDELRIISGLNFRHDQANSESYFNGSVSKDIWRAFGNIEYQPSESWRINVGLMAEKDSLIGSEISPRFAVNWLISQSQSARFVYSKANRSPDLFEERNQRTYTVRDLSEFVNGTTTTGRFYQHSQSTGNLDFEQIENWELGYYFRNQEQSIEWDIKWFHEQLSQLIEGRALISNYSLTNNGRLELTGIESQLSWQINNHSRLWAALSIIDQDKATENFYYRSSVDSTLSLNYFHRLTDQLSLTTSYYEMQNFFTNDFQRIDFTASYRTQWLGEKTLLKFGYQHRLDDNYLLDIRSIYTNPDTIFVTAEVTW